MALIEKIAALSGEVEHIIYPVGSDTLEEQENENLFGHHPAYEQYKMYQNLSMAWLLA
jgi:hypothetical protein